MQGGLVFDSSVRSSVDLLDVSDKQDIQLGLSALESVDIRKNTQFRYYETGSPFEYLLVRYAYLRMRDVQVEK
jgi:phospholipid-binding lipoprotein MlaA